MPKSQPHIFSSNARWAFALILWVGVASLLASCGDFPFQTREAEPPATAGSNPVVPLTPGDVLSNLVLSVNTRDAVLYGENFTNNFTFKPDPSDSVEVEKNFPGAYANWTLFVEEGVADFLLDPIRCSYANLRFEDELIVDFTDSTYLLQENYFLILKHASFVEYRGQVRFFMRKLPDGYWYIERWVDYIAVDQYPTWGRLKGETRARM